ncbi:MAG TPA: TadE family protein [Coriobacteriia bacterium]|jgi:Flp pilus assembly protein TadG
MSTDMPRMREETGAAAVEFALVVVLLFMLLLGIMQFGLTMSQWLQVVHSAREGARWAALQAPESEVRTRVANAATPITPKRIDISPGDYATPAGIGKPVTVTVYYDPAVISPLFGGLMGIAGIPELKSSATLRVD